MNERFIEAINYLISEKIAYNQSDLARILGIGRSQISAIKNGYGNVSKQIVSKMEEAFPMISSDWILRGDGEMLKSDTSDIPLDKPMEFGLDELDKALRVAEKMGVDLIPMYTEPFRAGNQGHNLIEEWDEVESVWAIPDTHATRLAPVRGNSMEPTLHDGDIVAIKRMEFRIDEPLSIPFGEIFGIVVRTSDDPDDREYLDYIKRLDRHPESDKHLTHWIAHSDNSNYKDFEIRIDRVASLWRVKASVAVQRFS